MLFLTRKIIVKNYNHRALFLFCHTVFVRHLIKELDQLIFKITNGQHKMPVCDKPSANGQSLTESTPGQGFGQNHIVT